MFQTQDAYWWKQDEKDVYKNIFSYIKHLETSQGYRSDENLRYMRLYGNLEPFNLKNYAFFRAEPVFNTQNRVTFNIIASMVDTIVSKITKNRPKPTFLTEGGDWELQRKAQKLTQYVEGIFTQTEYYKKSAIAFKDACIFGTGAIKVYRVGNEIKSERVFIDELIVDESEAVYGEPRQLHQKKWIHKDVLKGMFPDAEAVIDAAGSTETSAYMSNTYDKATNMLLVIESWHLPSHKDSDDGIHTICIENHTLFTEAWTYNYFPFVFHRYSLRPIGFWGQGVGERVSGIQLELNKILRTIQVSMHLVSVPKLLVEASSKIVSAHLNNKIGGIIKYAGTPPTSTTLGNIPQELFQHAERIVRFAYQQEGISELSAQSMKPAGLNSGKAMRVYNDLETERFLELATRHEHSFLDAARMFINLAKEISDSDDKFTVKVKGKRFLETIDWKDISLDEDSYLMQLFPTNALASDPAGRLQDVQDLMQAGLIGKEDGMKLLDFPDLRQFYNFNNAGLEDIERSIELIVDESRYESPEPYQNLQLGITKFQQAYLMYKAQNLPEDKLELLRRWIEDAQALIQRAQTATQMQAQQGALEQQAQAQQAAAATPNAEQEPTQPETNQPIQ